MKTVIFADSKGHAAESDSDGWDDAWDNKWNDAN